MWRKWKCNDSKGVVINYLITALRQWLAPAVADEPTTHVVPFYVHCVNCFMSWFHV